VYHLIWRDVGKEFIQISILLQAWDISKYNAYCSAVCSANASLQQLRWLPWLQLETLPLFEVSWGCQKAISWRLALRLPRVFQYNWISNSVVPASKYQSRSILSLLSSSSVKNASPLWVPAFECQVGLYTLRLILEWTCPIAPSCNLSRNRNRVSKNGRLLRRRLQKTS
jgi:hypothetical protein